VHGPALEIKLITTGKPWVNYMINVFPQRKKDERKKKINENCGCEMHRAAKIKKNATRKNALQNASITRATR
jgi:N-acetylmuramic acid 6-phosphate (MurNAc-6-P) etherase